MACSAWMFDKQGGEAMKNFRVLIENHLNSFRTILLGFLLLILLGALLLWLPFSSNNGQSVPFLDAMFTATSATCVTGLVVFDTASQWTIFGRSVILLLIQIGGLGVATAYVATLMLTGKRVGLMARVFMQDSVSAPQLGGIAAFTKFFIKGTIIVELAGFLLLLPVFIGDFGMWRGIGYALFHSISAFCNAGFDLLGGQVPFSSLTRYADHAWVNIVIVLLILIGGIGFFTWRDLLENRFDFMRLRLQTKVILMASAVLLVVPFAFFFLVEFRGVPGKERALLSLFQTVTPRTAGFNTADYNAMSEAGVLVTILLMLVGGAPGSTAGGMKITTVSVMFLTMRAGLKGKTDINVYDRRIEGDTIRNAFLLLSIYLSLLIMGTLAISVVENMPVLTAMFECTSALCTVGLAMVNIFEMHAVSKIILMVLMYIGRVGGLTLAYGLLTSPKKETGRFPVDKMTIG